jgi:hypothetical protein
MVEDLDNRILHLNKLRNTFVKVFDHCQRIRNLATHKKRKYEHRKHKKTLASL